MASMQVRRLRRSPRGSAGAGRRRGEPGAAVPPGACVRPCVRAWRGAKSDAEGGTARAELRASSSRVAGPARAGGGREGPVRDGGETRRGARGEAGTRTAAGGAGAGGGTGPGARGKRRLREASGSDAAAPWAGEGRAKGIPVPRDLGGRSFAGRMGMCIAPCGVGGAVRETLPGASWGPRAIALGSWGYGAVSPRSGGLGQACLAPSRVLPVGFSFSP